VSALAQLFEHASPVCPPVTRAELRALRCAIEAEAWSTMGDPAPAGAQVWSEVAPTGGSFTFSPGSRYAVLASVTTKASLPQVTDKLTSKGFSVSYAWTQGQASRGLYCVDTWLGQLPPPPSGEAWVYVEADFTAATPDVEPVTYSWGVWPVTLDVYSIAHVFEAMPAATATNAFDCQPGGAPAGPAVVAATPAPSKAPYVLGGAVAGSLATLAIRAIV
jgi:hypothetical protein